MAERKKERQQRERENIEKRKKDIHFVLLSIFFFDL